MEGRPVRQAIHRCSREESDAPHGLPGKPQAAFSEPALPMRACQPWRRCARSGRGGASAPVAGV